MISRDLIKQTLDYFDKHIGDDKVVKPSLPILYFGNEVEYRSSKVKIVTVGKIHQTTNLKEEIDFPIGRKILWKIA